MKIPIKKYVMDESLSWEERYKKLEAHHYEETAYLVSVIAGITKIIDTAPQTTTRDETRQDNDCG